MSEYQVIARKWRPQKFADVIGQEHITQTLQNAIRANRIAHAYLFVGPRGTGKTTTARIFAKALNCEKGPTVTPCDQCNQCKEIIAGNSMNVLEIDGASNRGIDEIRQLRDTVKYAPAGARFKVYIIDEVHMLTKEAFNALLKTLEEPPKHVKFFFATTEPEKVLPTILSRCQRFDFRRIPAALIVQHLATIAEKEGVRVSREALFAIARGAEGGMRDAQCALDQLISYCGNEIREGDVLAMYGLTASGKILELVRAILQGDGPGVIRSLHQITEGGKDLQRLLLDLIGHFRTLLLLRQGIECADVLDIPETQLEELKPLAAAANVEGLYQIVELLAAAEGRIRWSTAKKIVLETTLLKAARAREAVGVDTLIEKLNDLKRNLTGACPPSSPTDLPSVEERTADRTGGQERQSKRQVPTSATAPSQELKASQDGPDSLWQELLERVGNVSLLCRSHLLRARPLSYDGRTLVIAYPPEFAGHKELAEAPHSLEVLRTKLREIVRNDVAIQFQVIAEPQLLDSANAHPVPKSGGVAAFEPTEPPPEPSARKDAQKFRDDPLIRKALEIFRGQIVDVKA